MFQGEGATQKLFVLQDKKDWHKEGTMELEFSTLFVKLILNDLVC